MSPAPETLRRPLNPSPSTSSPPSISISTILSRAPRIVSSDANSGIGSFSADRRASASIRRNFSGGPRPAPFRRVSLSSIPMTTTTSSTNPTLENETESGSTRALLLSALESRRRRIEELRAQANVASTIAEQWRRHRSEEFPIRSQDRGIDRSSSSERLFGLAPPSRISPESFTTPIRQNPNPPALLFNDDTSDTESEDDEDPDNKFPGSMNDIRRTPPPTFITPHTSPSQSTDSPTTQNDDDSSRNAYTLSCRYCANVLTKRGMRARLVADAGVHIWSTDEEPRYSVTIQI